MVGEARKSQGRKEKTSCLIVDAQSVKNTDTANEKGYDAGKKVSGIKRHIAVDTGGLPHAIGVTTANITDRKGALGVLCVHDESLTDVTCVLGDSGYTGEPFAQGVKELHQFKVLPKRWVVERSFAWLEKNRRLWRNCERLKESSVGMVSVAYIALLLRRS